MFKHLVSTIAAVGLLSIQAHAGIILNFFPVADYNANTATMDATLGTTGYTIDNFETTTLIPGLTITLSGGVPLTTFTSLPALLDQGACPGLTDNTAWDGTHVVANITTNTFSNCTGPANIASSMALNYVPGTTSLGVGFGNFQSVSTPPSQFPITNHELFVNGIDEGVLETLAGANWTPGLARNTYLRVDGTSGTMITSITVTNLTASDVLLLDHVAAAPSVTAIPEPSTALPMVVAGLLLTFKIRRNSF